MDKEIDPIDTWTKDLDDAQTVTNTDAQERAMCISERPVLDSSSQSAASFHLAVNEIFTSLSGEVDGFGLTGKVATFIRLQGCNLRCEWCDTLTAQSIRHTDYSHSMSIDNIIITVKLQQRFQKGQRHIIITGGEPLLQLPHLVTLILKLSLRGQGGLITIETNGTIPFIPKDFLKTEVGTLTSIVWRQSLMERIRFVVDYKLPSSKMQGEMYLPLFSSLRPCDVIKFVVATREDYLFARTLIRNHSCGSDLEWHAQIVFSPVLPEKESFELAKTILHDMEEGLLPAEVQINVQLHKVLKIR
jgi:7-carboxy-7-deazaguanine synthase